MKVLFVTGGNSENFGMASFIKAQGESIRQEGLDVDYFLVDSHGLGGYLKTAIKLRKWLRKNSVDLIHAHYTLCGWVSVLAFSGKPIILSLMGTDAYGKYIDANKIKFRSRYLVFLTWLIQPLVKAIISKSANIENRVYRKRISHIIPNGVMLDKFKIYEGGCRKELGLDPNKKYVLFLGNPQNKRKNIKLVQEALALLNRPDVELLNPFPIPQTLVVKYLNSVDALATCSFMEGSSNVIKEAMACNCPMVVTNAGDSAWVIRNTEGCMLASFDAQDYAEKLERVLDFAEKRGRTQGRRDLIEMGLDAKTVAIRITQLYLRTLNKRIVEKPTSLIKK